MKKKTLALVAGGTAGHLSPAIALGEILATNNRILFLTDNRGSKYLKKDLPFVVKKFQLKNRGTSLLSKITAAFWIAIATFKALYWLKKGKVQLVVAFGGLTNLPTLLAAEFLKIPFLLHEQNAFAGKGNRFFLSKAGFIATSFSDTKGLDDLFKDKIIHTGNPIRKEVFYSKRRKTKITREIQILVIGGSQGAEIFDHEVTAALMQLSEELQGNIKLFQQAKNENLVKETYAKSKIKQITIANFFTDLGQIMADSDLIITRGGASALAEIEHLAIPAIVIPLAKAADNHQFYNAQALEATGLAKSLEEKNIKNLPALLKETLENLALLKKKNPTDINYAAEKLAIKVNNFLMKNTL